MNGITFSRALFAHGVCRRMHCDPQITNYGPAGREPDAVTRILFAIEPMITAGSWGVVSGEDGWAVFTDDGSLAAHIEHTVAVTEAGPRVLTPRSTARQVATG